MTSYHTNRWALLIPAQQTITRVIYNCHSLCAFCPQSGSHGMAPAPGSSLEALINFRSPVKPADPVKPAAAEQHGAKAPPSSSRSQGSHSQARGAPLLLI